MSRLLLPVHSRSESQMPRSLVLLAVLALVGLVGCSSSRESRRPPAPSWLDNVPAPGPTAPTPETRQPVVRRAPSGTALPAPSGAAVPFPVIPPVPGDGRPLKGPDED